MDMTLGEKISFIRQIKNLTQEELAIKSNISKNSIWNYENNKRTPNFKILSQIANGLEESVLILTDNAELFKFANNTLDENDQKHSIPNKKAKDPHIKFCNIFEDKNGNRYTDYSANELKDISYVDARRKFQSILDYIKINSKYESLKLLGHDPDEEKLLFQEMSTYLEQQLLIILINRGELISKNDLIKGDDLDGNQEE